MSDKEIEVKNHRRSKPGSQKRREEIEKTPDQISDPQTRATEGVVRLGGAGTSAAEIKKGVTIVRRRP